MEQVNEKGSTHKFNKKNYQNNKFRTEVGQKQEKQLTLTEKKSRLTFNNKNLSFFSLKSKLYKSKFAKTCMSYEIVRFTMSSFLSDQ